MTSSYPKHSEMGTGVIMRNLRSHLEKQALQYRKKGHFAVSLCQFSSFQSLFLCVDRECKAIPLFSFLKNWNC